MKEVPSSCPPPSLPALDTLCPYGQSKLTGEQYLGLYGRMYGLSSTALRFANVYGPRQNPKGEAGVVAIFGELLLNGGQPVVFGDGTQTRDYVFVDDVIEAIVSALNCDIQGPVNIGNGVETSLLAMIEQMARSGRELGIRGRPAGADFEPVFEPARPGEVMRIAIDPTRANRELDWRATTGLDDGLRHTLEALSRASLGHD